MARKKRKPLKHLTIPESLGIGEGGKTLPYLYEYFQQVDDYIEELKTSGGKEGEKGDDGKSAYQVAVDDGFEGSESEWLESLKGKDGTGTDGNDGDDGISVTGATSDDTNITFELSDGNTIEIPWPTQE